MTPQWRAFLAFEIARNRELYALADTGIAMLPPRSARCVGAARVLYAQILDRIEAADYDVFSTPGPSAHLAQGHHRRSRSWWPARRGERPVRQPHPTGKESRPCRSAHPLTPPASRPASRRRPAWSRLPMPESVRARIPIYRVPQPRENRMTSDLAAGQAAPDRGRARGAQDQNSGGWFVAGSSADVAARSRSPAPSPAARSCSGATALVRLWPGRAPARTSGR